MAVYNEADIIEQVLKYHIGQGLELVIIDNGSSDGTYDVLKRYVGHGVVELQRIETDYFAWGNLLSRLSEIAARLEPDWVVLIGADEFLETPNAATSETLLEGIKAEATKKYDVIQFDAFTFWPTYEDDVGETDVRRRMKYYTWHHSYNFRAYRWIPGASMAKSGGHYPTLPPGVTLRISPRRFIIRHYQIRSYEHGMRKVFRERLPRYRNRPPGFQVHYEKFRPEKQFFIRDPKELSFYSEDRRWERTRKFDPTFGGWNPPPDDWIPPGMTR